MFLNVVWGCCCPPRNICLIYKQILIVNDSYDSESKNLKIFCLKAMHGFYIIL